MRTVDTLPQRIIKMTHALGNSEDESSELELMLRGHGTITQSKLVTRNILEVPPARLKRNTYQQPEAKSRAGAKSLPVDVLQACDVQVGESLKKSRPRKRVLNKLFDNSLLRPLQVSNRNVTKLSPVGDSKRPERKDPARSKIRQPSGGTGSLRMGGFCEEEDNSEQDSTGLSDFIVNDGSSLEGEEDSVEETVWTKKTRSVRRLIRGRRQSSAETPLEVQSISSSPRISSRISPHSNSHVVEPLFNRGEILHYDDKELNIPSVISMSSHRQEQISDENIPDGVRPVTPPPSLQKTKNKLASPKKLLQIPSTSHRSSMDAFWSQEAVNEWNNQFSPSKATKFGFSQGDNELDEDMSRPCKGKGHPRQDQRTLESRRVFDQKKRIIGEDFLRELDDAITDGKISELAASTGGVKIIWSKTLNTTAGRANWRRETVSSKLRGPDGKLFTKYTYKHHASIELAEKVINEEDRLLNVLAHEFCHLANFMVSGIKNNPHGKEFKSWASKCSLHFKSRGILVTTKHSYVIDFKYIWECSNCGVEFKRHSKSINPLKQQCGSCKGKLQQTKPVPRANVARSEYQEFMKEHLRRVKKENPGSPQKQVMVLMGKMYQEYKAAKLGSNGEMESRPGFNARETQESKKSSPTDKDVDLVVRQLDFLDLKRS